MKEHPFFILNAKLRPELKKLKGNALHQAFAEVGQLFFNLPVCLITIIWLVLVFDLSALRENILLSTLLIISMLIANNSTATLMIEIEPQKSLIATSSLGLIFLWTGLFILGPVFMWVNLLADTISVLLDAHRRSKLGQNIFWAPFASYIQGFLHILGGLLGLAAYSALGGEYPLTSLQPIRWLPALVAILVSAIVSGTITMPTFVYLSKIIGMPISLRAQSNVILTVAISVLAQAPFAIPIALVYVYAGMGPFIFLLLGLILVNLLAYHLSETNLRSVRQSREMAQLENLGEEIIQAAPDDLALAEMLKKNILPMFSDGLDIFEIRILGESDDDLHIVHPTESAMPSRPLWERLWESPKHYLILKEQAPAGAKSVYGDAIMVKIFSASPVDEGVAPACIGGIYLLRHKSVARTTDSLSTVQALASQIASALYRTEMYAETLASEKMSSELAIAGEIQASFLPESVPNLDGWKIVASLTPARQTSGDFYDFIEFNDGKIGFLVADVADKGTGAALYMALSRTLIRTFALQHREQPEVALRLANERILEDARADQFVTVFYGILDPKTGSLTYCNAGHNPPYIFREDDPENTVRMIRTGMALGVMEGMDWTQKTVQLEPGDLFIAYSDGITDAQNTADELFSEERLVAVSQQNKRLPAEKIHEKILAEIQTFVGDAPQFDDMTLMVIKRDNIE